MIDSELIPIGFSMKETQADVSKSCTNLYQPPDTQTKRANMPLAYYEQLMRHDWHIKVHHRVRQRGWGR
jgi:hypothetical protein